MNISSAASFQTPYPQIAKASMEKNLTEKIEGPVIDEGRVMLTIEKLMHPTVIIEITIEELDELDEFLKTPENLHSVRLDNDRKNAVRFGCFRSKEFHAGETLRKMEGIYSEFKQDLRSKWPDLADKVTGFTVDEDGRLKVTSPPNTLDTKEEEIMNTLLNGTKDLQSLTLKHAKVVIELVQMDKQQFEGKVKVTLSNFHKLIDYGFLLIKGALHMGKTDSWLDQLNKSANIEQHEKKQGLHIEA
jgi:hypothetical protein